MKLNNETLDQGLFDPEFEPDCEHLIIEYYGK